MWWRTRMQRFCLRGTSRSDTKGRQGTPGSSCTVPAGPVQQQGAAGREGAIPRGHGRDTAGTHGRPELLLQITLETSAGASNVIETWSPASPGRSRTSASAGGCSPGKLQMSEQLPITCTGRDLLPVPLLLQHWCPPLFFSEGLQGDKMCRGSLHKLTERSEDLTKCKAERLNCLRLKCDWYAAASFPCKAKQCPVQRSELWCVAGFILHELWQLITSKICNSFGVEGESHVGILTCTYSKTSPTVGLNLIFPGI